MEKNGVRVQIDVNVKKKIADLFLSGQSKFLINPKILIPPSFFVPGPRRPREAKGATGTRMIVHKYSIVYKYFIICKYRSL